MVAEIWSLLTPLAVRTGTTCLTAHIILFVLFSTVLPSGPWSAMPSFTAHQAVCFPLLAYLSYEGVRGWVFQESLDDCPDLAEFESPEGRILGLCPSMSNLAEVAFGMMVFWDIPTGLVTKDLRDPAMMAHHFSMAAVSALAMGNGRPILAYYVPFFFGVIEISSVPLSIVDVFHPKHKPWHRYLETSPGLQSLNEVCRVTFAVLFLLLRGLIFPYVITFGVVPDVWHVVSLPESERGGASLGALYGMVVFCVLFTILQLYWAFLVVRQVMKALAPPKKEKVVKKND